VLEIEAVDGRSRSYASRARNRHRRKAVFANRALVESLRGKPPDAAHGKSQDEEVCGVSFIQTEKHDISDCRRKQAISRYGGRCPESRLHHPFTGVA